MRRLLVSIVLVAACGEVKPSIIDATPPIDAFDAVAIDALDVDAAPGMATVTVVRGGNATGVVMSTPAGIDCGTTCAGSFPVGTVVTLTATPGSGAVFVGWGGACSGTLTSCSITLSASVAVNADFGVAQYPVTAVVSGNGTGTVTSTPAGIICPGACTTMVAHGSVVMLAAAPASGSTFLGWSGASCTGTGTCVLTVTAPVTLNASFALNNSLVVTRAGNGSGTVTSAPSGINCGADCSEAYAPGTPVTLTATAAVGSTFTGWSGSCSGPGACAVTMNMSHMVTATFTLNQYLVTVAKAGTGSGTVTSSPAGITCGNDCTETVNHGSMTMLTAVAAAGSTFAGWSGGGCSGTGTCTVTATAATTVTATFTLQQFVLTVERRGTGVGSVTSSPVGIACGTDCTQTYDSGTVVTLTAAVVTGSGSTFAGWSGGGCTGMGTCVTTVTAAATVSATFTLTGPGGALVFDGTNDLATLATSALLDTPIATVEFWVNLETVSGAAVSLWGPGGGPDKYLVQFLGAAAPGVVARIARASVAGQDTAGTTMTVGSWVHIALVYNGASMIVYRNGVQATILAVPGALAAADGPLRLGIENIGLTGNTFMRGQLDEVRIWNVARSAAQLGSTYNRLISTSTAGLVAYYRFDEVTGQPVRDSTTNGLDGVLGAAAAVATDDPSRVASTAPVTP